MGSPTLNPHHRGVDEKNWLSDRRLLSSNPNLAICKEIKQTIVWTAIEVVKIVK